MVKIKLAGGREVIFPSLTHLPREGDTIILTVPPTNLPTIYAVLKVTHVIEDPLGSGTPKEHWVIRCTDLDISEEYTQEAM